MLKSDVIASGQSRGAHNCGECDETVVGYLKKYKATQDKAFLQRCLDEDGDETPRRYVNVKADRAALRARRIMQSMIAEEGGR